MPQDVVEGVSLDDGLPVDEGVELREVSLWSQRRHRE